MDSSHNPNLINFLPIRSDNLKIFGVWAYNHRAKKFGDNVSGETIRAIESYKEWLVDADLPCVFGGDFNNSVIWDKPNNKNNFQNINTQLESLGFVSAYHTNTDDDFGCEESATFYHTKQESKKYHIDYIYSKNLNPLELKVGSYNEWISYSDHSPLIAEMG